MKLEKEGKPLKIVVYAICKDEEQFVDRWMDSMSEADQVVVLDTGSTDGTVEKLRARGAEVTVETVVPPGLGPGGGAGPVPVHLVLQRRRLRGRGVLV